jgi:hypothetical protein
MKDTLERKYVSRSRRKFLRNFPKGYLGEKYLDWERNYKWEAHKRWEDQLNEEKFRQLLREKKIGEIAGIAIAIESRTNLLFSFEKMALRDAVRSAKGARIFAEGLFSYVYGKGSLQKRFEDWAIALKKLPVVKTRVHTWPLQTVFGFIANPSEHIFLKPRVTQAAAAAIGYPFDYASRPNWKTYKSILDMAEEIRKETKDLHPRDYIDLQSFIWVMGSEEYD